MHVSLEAEDVEISSSQKIVWHRVEQFSRISPE